MKKYTVNELQNTDFNVLNNMDTEELRNYVIQGKKTSENRRKRVLQSVEKGHIALPIAYSAFKPSKKSAQTKSYVDYEFGGGNINTINNMSRNELLRNAKQIKSFLNAKTSTVKGWKEYAKGVRDRLRKTLEKISGNKLKVSARSFYGTSSKEFWKLYDKWKEYKGGDFGSYVGGSNQAQLDLYEVITNIPNLLETDMFKYLENIDIQRYEELEGLEDDFMNDEYYPFK